MIKNLKIRQKLLLGFGIITLIMLVIGTWNYKSFAEVDDKKVDLLSVYETADAIMESKFYLINEAQILMEILYSENIDEIEKYWLERTKAHNTIMEVLPTAISLLKDDTWGHEFVKEKQSYLNEIQTLFSDYQNSVNKSFEELISLIRTSDLETIEAEINTIDKEIDSKLFFMIDKLVEVEHNMNELIVENAKSSIQQSISNSERMSIILMIIGLVVAVIISITLAGSITKPIVVLKGIIEQLGAGKLQQEFNYSSNDEVGDMTRSLKSMTENLNRILSEIYEGSDNIVNASMQISTSSQQLSQGASEQASSVEEVSSTMEEMTANIEQNSANANQTHKISTNARNGINIVNSKALEAIDANQRISEKIGVINDIAFQTNILALNAAVEAARAGEHGKGFAVVAAEVRKLAENSKGAAEEIVNLSHNSLKLTQEAGEKLGEMLPEIEKTSNLIQEISAASNEQNNGAGQVNSAIQQLNGVTQQNAAASEELATNAEEMSSQAEQLKQAISFFDVSISNKNRNMFANHKPDKSSRAIQPTTEKTIADIQFESF